MRFPLVLLFAGCAATPPGDGGTRVWTMFPFDGARTWEYTSTDTEVSYTLLATSSGEPDRVGGTAIYTVVYTTSCFGVDPGCVDGEVLRKLKGSSDATDGVSFHAFDVGAGFVDLDPPVQLTLDDMSKDDTVETESLGATWTSTMLGLEPCPGNPSWEACGAFELAVDSGDGGPIAGTWWATVGQGVAAFELANEAGRWELVTATCDGECDGTW